MKKIIFILVWIIAGITVATAQISSYSFEYTAGTYSEITGGTVVYSDAGLTEPLRLENYAFAQGRTLIGEPANVTGFPIGFSFIFGSQTFTHFAVSPNGFIYLGGATPFLVDAREVSSDINVGLGLGTKNPILSDRERFEEGAINVLGFSRVTSSGTDDISATTVDANTEISYLLSGTAGDRVLTIQFKQIILSYSPTVQDPVDIQIRLYEANSKVEMIFNNFNIGSDRVWAEIGLKGDVLGNTKYLTTSASSNWSTATAGVTGNVNLFNAVCANGTTFAFTPPPFCVEPASQATALEIAVASNSISGSFTAAEADEYLVLIGKDISLTGSADRPADNTTYVAGQEIGKFTVVARSSATTFEAKGLEGSSNYAIHIYALNSNCLNGPKYRRANPLIADVTTLPGAPVLSLAEGGFTSLKLATEANQANNPVIIAQNTGQYAVDNNNNQLNDGAFGMPTAGVNVGDLLEGGGTVIYKGAVSNAIEVNGLNPGELVNFAAWSYDANENAVSSLFAKLNITTWGTLPYVPNFSQYAPYAIPEGWEEEGGIFQLTMNNSNRRGDFLQGRVTTASPVNPASGSVATQYLQLAPGNSRLILSGKLEHTTPRPFVTSGYTEWEDNDSMVFSAKKVGDTDYTTVYTIDKANAGDFFKNAGSGAFSDIAIPIEGFGGAIAKV
ncbi:MAG: hypothetical protein LBH90_03850, partial [Tannerella sp.]|nr:hypothetical protein [Tannerella sp.]